MSVSLIIPTYRNPKYLDICLKSAIEGQHEINEIIVAVDGYIEESQSILDKYKDDIKILNLGQNQGMQMALNLGVYNANFETICIINDDPQVILLDPVVGEISSGNGQLEVAGLEQLGRHVLQTQRS